MAVDEEEETVGVEVEEKEEDEEEEGEVNFEVEEVVDEVVVMVIVVVLVEDSQSSFEFQNNLIINNTNKSMKRHFWCKISSLSTYDYIKSTIFFLNISDEHRSEE